MLRRNYGNSGLEISILGYGAGHIGSPEMDENYVGYFLNQIVDSGITLIDTARGYGLSEERIGRHLSWRRKDYILSTKVGYGIPGYADWTYEGIIAGIEEALRLLRTDWIDIVHLHSCPLETLQKGDVIRALDKARADGKIRAAAYSGENEASDFTSGLPEFQGLQTSVNITDQRSIDHQVLKAFQSGKGVIAKRPIANAPWRFHDRPYGNYAEEYWHRWKTMNLDPMGLEWEELFLRFTAFTPGVTSSIVGTTNMEHLRRNISALEKGPLEAGLYQDIRECFRRNDQNWSGMV